jgi:hypothetical protein
MDILAEMVKVQITIMFLDFGWLMELQQSESLEEEE